MSSREGSLEAPERQPLDWKNPEFYDRDSLNAELERVFDICHGCRRCVSLCDSFPTLFDLVDESDTLRLMVLIRPTTTRSSSSVFFATSVRRNQVPLCTTSRMGRGLSTPHVAG